MIGKALRSITRLAGRAAWRLIWLRHAAPLAFMGAYARRRENFDVDLFIDLSDVEPEGQRRIHLRTRGGTVEADIGVNGIIKTEQAEGAKRQAFAVTPGVFSTHGDDVSVILAAPTGGRTFVAQLKKDQKVRLREADGNNMPHVIKEERAQSPDASIILLDELLECCSRRDL